MNFDYDIAVIGGGPGGYVAAIRAAQLGAKVALIEKDQLGGTCLNRGCIPTKALLAAAGKLNAIKEAKSFGIEVGEARPDLAKMIKRKNDIVRRLKNGVGYVVQKNGITIYAKQAAFVDEHTLDLEGEQISSAKFIIATGSSPRSLFLGDDGGRLINSDQLLDWQEIPSRLAIIGGGVIGVEFAQIFHSLGSQVTIIEIEEQILPGIDWEVTAKLGQILKKRGIKLLTGSRITEIEGKDHAALLEVDLPDGSADTFEAELVLCATGRKPYFDGLNLDVSGVAYNPAGIPVDKNLLTNQPHIAAIGDVTGGIQLAHFASAQGLAAAEFLMGSQVTGNLTVIPSCIYGDPEVATVGLSQEQVEAAGIAWAKAVFPMQACGKAMAMSETDGFCKLIFDPADHTILGAYILAPHATDLIAEIALAMVNDLKLENIGKTIHPHPTISETLMEAAHLAEGRPIHIV
ncbi:MAG: dihydrolipoyl dehydrogenase [Clostridiales bacterium]|nr:dihydrolipoyl dehydrogenase [Clostridiales bacterium]